MVNIGRKLKHFRERLKITQQQLGEMVYVSESAIGNYETGKRNPSIDLLLKMADVLKVRIEEFFEEERKSLLQLPMDYLTFRRWADKWEEKHTYSHFIDEKFEYMMKSDRYFVELKDEYLVWLKDGFYLIPVENEFEDGGYYDVVKIEKTRKVLKKDTADIERTIKRKILNTKNEKIFAEQVYLSKYDYVNPKSKSKMQKIAAFEVDSYLYDVNHVMGYIDKKKSFYIYAKDGIYQMPIEYDSLYNEDEKELAFPYGVYEEEYIYVDKEKFKKIEGEDLQDLKSFVVEDEYFVQRLFGLLEKSINRYEKEEKPTFEQIENHIDEWERKNYIHPNDKDIIANFLRFRIWALDNLKRILKVDNQEEECIFEDEWEEEDRLKKIINDERAEEYRRKNEEKTNELKKKFKKQYKILVVDDFVFWRLSLVHAMKEKIYSEVLQAKDGQEAFHIYKEEYEKGVPFDLVTMDITMPTMDGFESTKKIIEYDEKAHVVMCTSLGSTETVKKCIRLGAKDFLLKTSGLDLIIEGVIKELEDE